MRSASGENGYDGKKGKLTWLETPTILCNHPQSWPLPMKLLAKHRILTLLVASKANMGTPAGVVFEKMTGACLRGETVERP